MNKTKLIDSIPFSPPFVRKFFGMFIRKKWIKERREVGQHLADYEMLDQQSVINYLTEELKKSKSKAGKESRKQAKLKSQQIST